MNLKRLCFVSSGDLSPMVKYWTIQGAEGMEQSLEAQLRATLNMIPAYTWYATPSGGADLRQRAKCGLRWAPERSSASLWNGHLASMGLAHPLSPSGRPGGDAAGLVRVSEDRPPWRGEFSGS